VGVSFDSGVGGEQVFFTIRWSDHDDDDRHGTELPDDAAALGYADRIIRELKDGGGLGRSWIDDGRQKRDAHDSAVVTVPGRMRLRLGISSKTS